MTMAAHEAGSRRMLETAIRENRAGELLDCLFEGGSATVDPDGALVLIPGSLLASIVDPDDETPRVTVPPICDRCRANRCDDCTLAVEVEGGIAHPCKCSVLGHVSIPAAVADLDLTFDRLRATNVARCLRWHPTFEEDDDPWTGADWALAMCGEAGEVANVVKKIRRHESGVVSADDPPLADLLAMLADEIADTVTYADLLAAKYGLDLGVAVASKFDRVSERQGSPERLGT